jgi:hypothetical protein
MIRRLCALALLAASGAAAAQDDAIVVTALRDPVQKSYRKMINGEALFEARRRELAPGATLRFKLIPRRPDTTLDDIQLKVESESVVLPVKLAADRTFVLQLNRTALREDAKVLPNRKAGTMTWRADVRTPGLPPDVRRLGDLRLECEVGMESGLISNYPSGFFGWLEELFGTKGPEFCSRPAPRYLFFTERPIWNVTLVDGARRESIPLERLYAGATQDPKWKEDRFCDCQAIFERTYFAPLGDASWSNDTLLEFESMDRGDPSEITRDLVRAVLGEGVVLPFAHGYEVWSYPGLTLLFDPARTLAKAR